MSELRPFEGGERWMRRAALAGGAGLALTAVCAVFDPRRAAFSYLVAFTYWAGLAVAATILLSVFHATHARWMVVLRRPLEALAFSVTLFAPLFVPLALALPLLFPWAAPEAVQGAELIHALEKKRFYLNVPFFLSRAVLYFALWIAVAWLLQAWSLRQDRSGALALTRKQRALGAASLPALGLSLSFASFDWLMSLEPLFWSSIFGVYYFAGSFLAALAALTLAAVWPRSPGLWSAYVNRDHLHSLGKLLLAFVVFWAYIAFSQYLLIWIADLPAEVPWYIARTQTGWRPLSVALVLGHFVLPFAALLSARLKQRPRLLAAVAAWLLLAHYWDLFWLALPSLQPQRPAPALSDLFAFAGLGALTFAFVAFRLRGRPAVPVKDPFLHESVRYSP